ncbi:lysyl oxidase family protein [Myxococcus hansupus]|uniref:lysyl oxidase family protein n=1 Tax=Pseudomyxococcus hansupus TaxID=1297742 RepID=UPI00202AA94A|nr:lysyl oxidase family protein [Myxococcus hansupus]
MRRRRARLLPLGPDEHLPGWTDIYVADIPCQWIDITGLADGTYSLRVGVDEQDIIEEADVHPNEALLNVHIQGDSVTVLP